MKIFTGKVVATKNAKTATIEVERFVTHPIYDKKIKRSRTFQVHDEIGVNVGDVVNFIASKPHSKTKKWEIYVEGKK
ncbi:MAG TPA: 30S ribosomal protein S17 [Patescibacteria group bacterium]|nr:30S ribosomal protein S17 [Patescibacteria group bacterium]